MRLINPNSSGRFVVRYDHYKPASFTTRAMPVETFRRLIWMNDRLDVPGSRGRDRSTPRWLPLNGLSLLHAALLFPSLSPLSSSPFSFSSTVPFRRANVADSRPREIASRTVVFHCLIRGARTGGWQEETPSGETRWRNSLFALRFSTGFSNEGERNRGWKFDGGEVRVICLGRRKGLFGWTRC